MPHCPECKKRITTPNYQRIEPDGDLIVPVVIVYCPNCGCILGVASQEQCMAE